MKTTVLVATVASAFALWAGAQDAPEQQQPNLDKESSESKMEKEPLANYEGKIDLRAISSNDVYNIEGEKVGNIDRFIVNTNDGNVVQAVVSVGGFLGIGDKLVAVPWSELQFKKADKTEMVKPADEAKTEEPAENEAQQEEAEQTAVAEGAEPAEVYANNAEEIEVEQAETDKETVQSEAKPEIKIYLDTTREKLENSAAFDLKTLQNVPEEKTEANQS